MNLLKRVQAPTRRSGHDGPSRIAWEECGSAPAQARGTRDHREDVCRRSEVRGLAPQVGVAFRWRRAILDEPFTVIYGAIAFSLHVIRHEGHNIWIPYQLRSRFTIGGG